MLNQNEKCLLKFVSCAGAGKKDRSDILSTILDLGIKIKFCDLNPVYQIIDEMDFMQPHDKAGKI